MMYWVVLTEDSGMRNAYKLDLRADGSWLLIVTRNFDYWAKFTELPLGFRKEIVRQVMAGSMRKVG